MKFNQKAIEYYIAESMRTGETGFTEALRIRTQHVANDLKKMTPAQKAGYCALVNRLARANKLVLD